MIASFGRITLSRLWYRDHISCSPASSLRHADDASQPEPWPETGGTRRIVELCHPLQDWVTLSNLFFNIQTGRFQSPRSAPTAQSEPQIGSHRTVRVQPSHCPGVADLGAERRTAAPGPKEHAIFTRLVITAAISYHEKPS